MDRTIDRIVCGLGVLICVAGIVWGCVHYFGRNVEPELTPAQRSGRVAFYHPALVERGGTTVKINVWVMAEPDPKDEGRYKAVAWANEMPDPNEWTLVDAGYHYKTAYMLPGLAGPNGEIVFVVDLRGGNNGD